MLTSEIVSRTWRVVVEDANRASALAEVAALDRAGFTVISCGGPSTLPGHRCPIVDEGRCPWVETADVVLCNLDIDDPGQQAILRALRSAYPDVPVVLELPEETARDHAALLDGCHVIYPFDMDHLVQAVIDAANAHERGEHPGRGLRALPWEREPEPR